MNQAPASVEEFFNNPNSFSGVTTPSTKRGTVEDFFANPDSYTAPSQLNQDDIREAGPVMERQGHSPIQAVGNWVEDFNYAMSRGESFSFIKNSWKNLLSPEQMAVPVKDKDGNTIGSRWENYEEKQERLAYEKQRDSDLNNQASSAKLTAMVVGGLTDPTTWAVPIGSKWELIRKGSNVGRELGKVAGVSSVVAAADSAAYQAANEGHIDPNYVGLAASLGFVLGPAVFYSGGRIIDAFISNINSGKSSKEALAVAKEMLDEQQKYLPAPPETLALPSPKTASAAHYINKEGVDVPYSASTKAELEKAIIQQEKLDAWNSYTPTPPKVNYQSKVAANLEKQSYMGELDDGGSAITRAFAKASNNEINNVRKFERGIINQNVLAHMATSTVGGAVGYALGEEEGLTAGVLIGLGAPFLGRALMSAPKRISTWTKNDAATKFANAKLTAQPQAVIKSFGKEGRWLAETLETAQQNVDLAVSKQLHKVKEIVEGSTKEDLLAIRRLLQHTLKPSQASKTQLTAAKAIRKELYNVLDDSAKVGIFTPTEVRALKVATAKNGYFPRVYDEVFLASSEGEKQWINTWKNMRLSRGGMKAALESILHDKDVALHFLKLAKENNSQYYLPSTAAKDLLRRYRNGSKVARSKHLEQIRKLDPTTEAALDPFIVKDPIVALTKYFNDVHKRLQFSQLFDTVSAKGTNQTDALMHAAVKEINKNYGDHAAKTAMETYYTVVGDSQLSKTMQALADRTDFSRAFTQGALSYEIVTKLGMAQMPNAFQATINGITQLLNKTSGNPFTTLSVYTKGLVKSLGKEGGEFADLSGAALETTLMEIAGESHTLSAIGEKFLRYSGFISIEKFQRRLGANMGKAYAESLLSKKARLIARNAHPNALKKVDRALKEIGIPTNRAVTEDDYYRAGLIFSNEINFRHTPDKVPLLWQSPFGKLMTQFKKFAFQQGRFVKENVIKPFLRGNPMPLLWYTAPAATVGMGVDELRRRIKGDDRELSSIERYLRGITMIGGLGLAQDVISSFAHGEARAATTFAGPTGSDVIRVGTGIAQSIKQQDFDPLIKAYGSTFASLPQRTKIINELTNEGLTRSASYKSLNYKEMK